MFNPSGKVIPFTVPERPWRLRIDTAAASPKDAVDAEEANRLQAGHKIVVERKSLRVLSCHPDG